MATRSIEILMVEDEASDIVLAEKALKEAETNTRLKIVRDGEEALNYLHQRHGSEASPQPDLILLDLNLPRVSGKEVLSEIKSDANLCHIPVIVLTTSSYEEDVLQCYQLHANCYITKPTDFHQFREVVKSINDYWLNMATLPVVETTGY